MLKLLKLEVEKNKEACNGKFYKAKFNPFINRKGEYVYQIRMIPIKKMSCPGCDSCWFLDEDLNERLGCFEYDKHKSKSPFHSGHIPNMEHLRHDHIYELKATNLSKDWETGYVDDWDLEFVEIKD